MLDPQGRKGLFNWGHNKPPEISRGLLFWAVPHRSPQKVNLLVKWNLSPLVLEYLLGSGGLLPQTYWPWGQKSPSEHPNPTTKIGSKMGGAPTPKWYPIGFDALNQLKAERRKEPDAYPSCGLFSDFPARPHRRHHRQRHRRLPQSPKA